MTTNNETQTQDKVFQKRITADNRLDMLYMREMRCPYCQTKMPKGTSKCENCALTKEQIYLNVSRATSGVTILENGVRECFWFLGNPLFCIQALLTRCNNLFVNGGIHCVGDYLSAGVWPYHGKSRLFADKRQGAVVLHQHKGLPRGLERESIAP